MTNDHAVVQTWLKTDESARRYLTVLNADNGYQASPNPRFKHPLYLVEF
jgi:hypothetical protein